MTAKQKTQKSQTEDAAILEIPVCAELDAGGYVCDYVDVAMTPADARTLKRITIQLCANGATTRKGKAIDRPADAIRWILEQVAEQCPE